MSLLGDSWLTIGVCIPSTVCVRDSVIDCLWCFVQRSEGGWQVFKLHISFSMEQWCEVICNQHPYNSTQTHTYKHTLSQSICLTTSTGHYWKEKNGEKNQYTSGHPERAVAQQRHLPFPHVHRGSLGLRGSGMRKIQKRMSKEKKGERRPNLWVIYQIWETRNCMSVGNMIWLKDINEPSSTVHSSQDWKKVTGRREARNCCIWSTDGQTPTSWRFVSSHVPSTKCVDARTVRTARIFSDTERHTSSCTLLAN